MKRCFVAAQRVKDSEGKNYHDDDGAFYLQPHPHKIFKNKDGSQKEFVNESEIIAAVQDHQNTNVDKAILAQANELILEGDNEGALALMAGTKKVSIGEVVILQILEF